MSRTVLYFRKERENLHTAAKKRRLLDIPAFCRVNGFADAGKLNKHSSSRRRLYHYICKTAELKRTIILAGASPGPRPQHKKLNSKDKIEVLEAFCGTVIIKPQRAKHPCGVTPAIRNATKFGYDRLNAQNLAFQIAINHIV